MTKSNQIEDVIKNSHLLTNFFGYWPSFHDAEVIQLILDRDEYDAECGPTLRAAIHVFEMTSEVDERGYYVLRNHSLVWLRFLEVVELSITDFNHQNVLWGLGINDISDSQLERVKLEVSFASSDGVDAKFRCLAAEVESVEPYTPGTSHQQP